MPDTRRAMHAVASSPADVEQVTALLSAESDVDAIVSFSLLRGVIPDADLLMLANLREVLFELPEAPFRAGEDLELLARAGDYEDTGHSYRRRFESNHGVFGLEFAGRGKTCEGIFVHTPAARMPLGPAGSYRLEPEMIGVFAHHRIVLDALLDALELLGVSLSPVIYLSAEDFLAEHGAAAASEAIGQLF
ncbi:MAG: hypothetical protein HGB10_06200 [Coriobacteriia bacterium]|nr:hypothetical protein [Coriobacteriia bacterium]